MKFRLSDLLELFGQEQACYTALLGVSRRQRQIIQAGESGDLLELLRRKQALLREISRIEADLAPYKPIWPRLRDTLSDDDRGVLDLALATVEELLAELIRSEKACERLLARRQWQVEQQSNDQYTVDSVGVS